MHNATTAVQSKGEAATETFVNKREIGQRLKVGSRKTAAFVTEDWWPAPIELSPRVLRWRWSEIVQALTERAPRRTERREPPQLAAARADRAAA